MKQHIDTAAKTAIEATEKAKAMEMCLTGRFIDAVEAERCGGRFCWFYAVVFLLLILCYVLVSLVS